MNRPGRTERQTDNIHRYVHNRGYCFLNWLYQNLSTASRSTQNRKLNHIFLNSLCFNPVLGNPHTIKIDQNLAFVVCDCFIVWFRCDRSQVGAKMWTILGFPKTGLGNTALSSYYIPVTVLYSHLKPAREGERCLTEWDTIFDARTNSAAEKDLENKKWRVVKQNPHGRAEMCSPVPMDRYGCLKNVTTP